MEKLSIKPLFRYLTPDELFSHTEIQMKPNTYLKENYIKKNKTIYIPKDDLNAALFFLKLYKNGSKNTFKSYLISIERFLIWSMNISKIKFKNLKRDHFFDYEEFLKNPIPSELFFGKNVLRFDKKGKANKNWRPFKKPCNQQYINHSFIVIKHMFNYLVDINYLSSNPIIKKNKKIAFEKKIFDRYLEPNDIITTIDCIDKRKGHDRKNNMFFAKRGKFVISLFFYTGMRISEACNHTMGDFILTGENWFLRVVGKGNKEREIPLPDDFLKDLSEFRTFIKLSPFPNYNETIPLIPTVDLKPTGTYAVYQMIKLMFSLASKEFALTNPYKASKLKAASPHWLRHSYVTSLIKSGADIKVVQENVGHSDINTTMIYFHVSKSDRHAATRKLSLNQ